MAPTIGAIVNTFADKTLDSRYDGTFVSVYRGNWPKGGVSNTVLYNANNLQVSPGDALLTFLNEEPITPIVYPSNEGTSNIGAATLLGSTDYVVGPTGISRVVYPALWKVGP